MRFSCARLTTFDDPLYVAFSEHMQAGRKNQRPMRPPSQRELFGNDVEHIVRNWVQTHDVHLSQRRILEYNERRQRNTIRRYRELDALIENEHQITIFEIKASRSVRAIRKAYQQLLTTQTILRSLGKKIHLVILLVDTGIPTVAEIEVLMRSKDAPEQVPQTFDQAINDLEQLTCVNKLEDALIGDPDEIAVVRFRLEDLIAIAGDYHLHLDWDLDDMSYEPLPQSSLVHSVGDNDNPFAAALLRALENE